jgi:hypothetical protein
MKASLALLHSSFVVASIIFISASIDNFLAVSAFSTQHYCTRQPLNSQSCNSFTPLPCCGPFETTRNTASAAETTTTALFAAKAKNKKKGGSKKKSTSAGSKQQSGGSFGFGKAAGKWDACEPLRAWMRKNGADVEGVSVGVVDPSTGLRGLLAARDFARGDPVFKVSRDNCILDESRADRSPVARHLYPTSSQLDALPPPIRNALLLLWLERIESVPSSSEEDKKEADYWKQYLEVLPTPEEFASEGGPMQLWSDDEVAQVECPQLVAEVATRKASLRGHYDDRVLPAWTAATDVMGPPPTFEEFEHAVCVVTSRNHGEGPVTGGSSSMLIPGVDLANHEDPPKANTKYGLAPWGDFVLLAKTTIQAGDQILSTYGPLPNRLLLAQFGFLLTDRTGTPTPLLSDTALVRIDGLFPDNLAAIDSSLPIPETEAAADTVWFDGPGPSMLAGVRGAKDSEGRVARWQPAEAARAAARTMFSASSGAGGEDVAAQATQAFEKLVQRELDTYSTTLEEDEATLASSSSKDLLPRSRWALQFRIEAKRLLMKELATP